MRKTPAAKGTPSKKVKKRNPWSDNESKSDSELEDSQPVIPRENKSQRASGQSNSASSWLNFMLPPSVRHALHQPSTRHAGLQLWSQISNLDKVSVQHCYFLKKIFLQNCKPFYLEPNRLCFQSERGRSKA